MASETAHVKEGLVVVSIAEDVGQGVATPARGLIDPGSTRESGSTPRWVEGVDRIVPGLSAAIHECLTLHCFGGFDEGKRRCARHRARIGPSPSWRQGVNRFQENRIHGLGSR
jgi:hypothetical protein